MNKTIVNIMNNIFFWSVWNLFVVFRFSFLCDFRALKKHELPTNSRLVDLKTKPIVSEKFIDLKSKKQNSIISIFTFFFLLSLSLLETPRIKYFFAFLSLCRLNLIHTMGNKASSNLVPNKSGLGKVL